MIKIFKGSVKKTLPGQIVEQWELSAKR